MLLTSLLESLKRKYFLHSATSFRKNCAFLNGTVIVKDSESRSGKQMCFSNGEIPSNRDPAYAPQQIAKLIVEQQQFGCCWPICLKA